MRQSSRELRSLIIEFLAQYVGNKWFDWQEKLTGHLSRTRNVERLERTWTTNQIGLSNRVFQNSQVFPIGNHTDWLLNPMTTQFGFSNRVYQNSQTPSGCYTQCSVTKRLRYQLVAETEILTQSVTNLIWIISSSYLFILFM